MKAIESLTGFMDEVSTAMQELQCDEKADPIFSSKEYQEGFDFAIDLMKACITTEIVPMVEAEKAVQMDAVSAGYGAGYNDCLIDIMEYFKDTASDEELDTLVRKLAEYFRRIFN